MNNGSNTITRTVKYIIQSEHPSPDTLSSSDWVAIISAFIALLALFATIYSSILQRSHNRLSSKPALNTVLDGPSMSLYLSNHGLGPAFLKEAEAILDGKTYNLLDEKESDSFSSHLCAGTSKGTKYSWMILEKDAAIAAGAEQKMLKIHSDNENEWNAVYQTLDRCAIKIIYESIYKEKGITTHIGNNVKEAASSGTNA